MGVSRVLVVGSGAREHAMAWCLKRSPQVKELFVAPGNAGTATIATNLPVAATDADGLIQVVRQQGIDLTLVGPEAPLAAGLVDRFQQEGLAIFGPTQAAAQIEASKGFAKEFMKRYRIPCADGLVFDSYEEACRFLRSHGAPIVVKADGLAAGKGVTVAGTVDEALAAVERCMVTRVFGSAGERVVIEEVLTGREVSVFAFTDGHRLSPLVAACDYKRLLDGDAGPNTGGMGSYSPPEFWDGELAQRIEQQILQPTVAGLAAEGRPYLGVLYGGLVMTEEGPKVLEFNCRLGDPEAQVILPRLGTDLVEIAQAVIEGELGRLEVRWEEAACVGVVLASKGYPGDYQKGLPVSGLEQPGPEALVFHAGTRMVEQGRERLVVTDGGRVLTVVGTGESLATAREQAYENLRHIRFQGVHYRRDIALVAGAVQA